MRNEAIIPSVHDFLKTFAKKQHYPDPANLTRVKNELQRTLPPFDSNAVNNVDNSTYKSIISRILFQTNALHEYNETGVTERLFSHDWQAPFGKDIVIWKSPVAKQMDISGRYVRGKIHIAADAPTEADILTSLGEQGRLPLSMRILTHERIHAMQNTYRQPIVVYSVDGHPVNFPTPIGPTELIEAQAQRTITAPPHLFSHIKWIQQMQEWQREGKGYTDIEDIKLAFAVTAVDTMNALGFTVSEIAALTVSPGDWDETTSSYPKIHQAIIQREKEMRVTPSVTNLQLLKKSDELERMIDTLFIMHTVREEVNQAVARRSPLVIFSSDSQPLTNN